MFGLVASLVVCLALGGCTRIKVTREVLIDLGVWAMPVSMVRSADGGLLMALDSRDAMVLKLDKQGRTEWRFVEPSDQNWNANITMVTALADGGALVCGARQSSPPDMKPFPGFVVRLDAKGSEVGRADPTRSGYDGAPFYETMACAPWGDGFVISAMEAIDPTRLGGFDQFDNGVVKITRRARDLSLVWSRPAKVGGFDWPTHMAPISLASGDLLFPSNGQTYVLAGDGSIKSEKSIGECRPLRAQARRETLAFSCDDYPGSGGLTILTYDSSLVVVGMQRLFDEAGMPIVRDFPIVAELPRGESFTLSTGSLSRGPIVTLHNKAGRQVDQYTLSTGLLRDVVADGDGVAILSSVTGNKYGMPRISWIAHQ